MEQEFICKVIQIPDGACYLGAYNNHPVLGEKCVFLGNDHVFGYKPIANSKMAQHLVFNDLYSIDASVLLGKKKDVAVFKLFFGSRNWVKELISVIKRSAGHKKRGEFVCLTQPFDIEYAARLRVEKLLTEKGMVFRWYKLEPGVDDFVELLFSSSERRLNTFPSPLLTRTVLYESDDVLITTGRVEGRHYDRPWGTVITTRPLLSPTCDVLYCQTDDYRLYYTLEKTCRVLYIEVIETQRTREYGGLFMETMASLAMREGVKLVGDGKVVRAINKIVNLRRGMLLLASSRIGARITKPLQMAVAEFLCE